MTDIRIGRLRHLLVAPGLLEVALVGSLDSFEVLGATRIHLNGAVSDAPTVLRWLYFHRGPVAVELFSSTTGYGALTEASFSEITDISPDEGDEMAQKQTQSSQGTQGTRPSVSCTPQEAQKLLDCCDDPACRKCIEDELTKCGQQAGAQAGAAGLDFSRLTDAALAGFRAFIQALLGVSGGGAQATKPTP
jgi:hypothetical protein